MARPGKGWFERRRVQAQDSVKRGLDRLSEIPGLPEPVKAVLRHTRSSLLDLFKSVRRKEDIKTLKTSAGYIVAGAVDEIAIASATDPSSEIQSVRDVMVFCERAIKYGAGIVDSVALVAGTFAAAAAAPTGGISFGHFFVLCYVMGLMYSLGVGASELYAVTSLLAHEGAEGPARQALVLCAYPRRYRGSSPSAAALPGAEADVHEPSQGASAEAISLAKTWAKLSFAGALPVFNDRHMHDRLERLVETLEARRSL
jgi:hypothetical protein